MGTIVTLVCVFAAGYVTGLVRTRIKDEYSNRKLNEALDLNEKTIESQKQTNQLLRERIIELTNQLEG